LFRAAAAAAPPGVDYDPYSPECQLRLHELYRVLRDHHPVYYQPRHGFYALTRYADVWNAATDPETFSSQGTAEGRSLLPAMIYMDPPRHDRLRLLVSRGFTAARVARLEPRVRAIARELVAGLAEAGGGDLLREYAAPLPSRVIGELIGIPREGLPAFLEWTEAMVATEPGQDREAIRRTSAERIYGAFGELLAQRRRRRRDDLMSALLDAEVEGVRLGDDELLGFCFLLVVAGNDTTTNLIGNGAVLLARHPEQRAILARERARIPDAIEEMLRYESPSQSNPRTAARDVELHGVRIPAGSRVELVFGAANRDPREFPDPDRFDVGRRPRHLAFGHGIHFCLGASLARLEGRVAFEELLARLPDYALDGEPGWLTSPWARAHRLVPIRS
jgi:cytochrome P450